MCGVDAEEVVGVEVGVERHSQQPTLPCGVDVQMEERRRQHRAVLDNAKITPLGGNEDAAIGGTRHGRRTAEAAGHKRFLEPGRKCGGHHPVLQ